MLNGLRQAGQQPAIRWQEPSRLSRRSYLLWRELLQVTRGKAGRVPQFGDQATAIGDQLGIKGRIQARLDRGRPVAQGVRRLALDQFQWPARVAIPLRL